ncbi:MAG TPA: GNAT family N-acetyltransferase [Anaerolineae bacterium]|jgi:ribosomal protein S18 acetylase RimI-like enzyme
MTIRHAELSDIDAIVELDHTYLTDHVWQMSGRDTSTEITSTFRLARLPRLLQVESPHDKTTLRRIVNRCDMLWVAEGEGARDIVGYVGMNTLPWQNSGHLPCLAVIPSQRRKGIASQLLRIAMAQAKVDGLRNLTIDIQTKNYPATRLCQTRGFHFAGYSDGYYQAQDIALFFAYKIR